MNTPSSPLPPAVDHLDLDTMPAGTISRRRLNMVADGLGRPVRMPLLIARGVKPGPVLGITAAVHGNELNGIPVVHALLKGLNLQRLAGTVLAVPAVNVPGLLEQQREFNDDRDLNHLFPGRADGTGAQVWAWRFLDRVVRRVDYLVDLHTASFGRVNSLYVRADMSDPVVANMARLQQPQIIVHNPPADGTLRGAAAALEIPAITVELKDPHRFQVGVIKKSVLGIRRLMASLGMIAPSKLPSLAPPALCQSSYWIYTPVGGLLSVLPEVTDRVAAGEVVARVRDVYGDLVLEHRAPEDGIVIGKSVNPVAQTGARVLHLGLVDDGAGEESAR